MATNEQGFPSRPPRGRGGRFDAGPPESRHSHNGEQLSSASEHSNSPPIHNVTAKHEQHREEHAQETDSMFD